MNKKFFFHSDSENTGVIQVTTHKNPAAVKGVGSPTPATHEASIYERVSSVAYTHQPPVISVRSSNSVICKVNRSPPALVSTPAKNNRVQLVPLNPSPISCADNNVSYVRSPKLYGKSPENSSSSEDSEDSDTEMSSGTTSGNVTLQSFHHSDKTLKAKELKNSLIPGTNFLHIGQQQAATATPQIIPSSAIQPVISYPQPVFIQPSPDGRTQQILVPIATVPLAGNNTNKIAAGGPQGLYLQTCPIVQGTNSSQTLQVATLPNCSTTSQSQHLLPSSLPIYINGDSTQLPSHSPQPIQIVTLASAAPHVVHS